MEEVRCESWSIARQLNALYESVGHICGVRVTAIDIGVASHRDLDLVRPTLPAGDDRQQLLEGLRQQDGLLRQQIRDLIAKLPIRTPADQVKRARHARRVGRPRLLYMLCDERDSI